MRKKLLIKEKSPTSRVLEFAEMTPEQLQRRAKRFVKSQTPLTGNICRSKKCRGRVVQKVTAMYCGAFYYSPATCEKCGRVYFAAGNVAKVGEQEFLEMLREPITI